MAVAAALVVAREAGPDDVLVVLLPDGGRGYLSKIFNDEWMSSYGFGEHVTGATIGDILRGKTGQLPDLVHTHPNETVADAVKILREYNVSQMPVVRAEPPIMAAEVAGSVVERDLLDALFSGSAHLADRVESHMSAPLPSVGSREPVESAIQALGDAGALMVLEDGKPVGVVSRTDLLGFLVS